MASQDVACDDGDAPIPAASYDDSDTSYAGEDAALYTTSLRSSIIDYKMKTNRRYHAYKEGSYYLPHDNQELKRLDMMHQMTMIVKGDRLYTAPIKSPKRILDLGCGTGIWVMEMGDEFPDAEVTGIDIASNQPTMVPPNVQFKVENMEAEWSFSQPFSYIHASYLLGAMSNHAHVFNQAYKHLEPGGWVEAYDYNFIYESDDGSWKRDDAMARWVDAVHDAMLKAGRERAPGEKLEGWFKEAGLVNVKSTRVKTPIGPWASDPRLKTIGAWNLVQILEGFEGFSLFLLNQVLDWPVEKVQALLTEAKTDVQNPHKHLYYTANYVVGMKPLDAELSAGGYGAPAATSSTQAGSETGVGTGGAS